MTGKSSPVPSTSSATTSKLPKFLRTGSSNTRDRAKSVAESSSTSLASSLSSETSASKTPSRKSKFLSRRSAEVPSTPAAAPPATGGGALTPVDEPPIIVEPVSIPRPRRTLSTSINTSSHPARSNTSSPTSPSSPSTSPPNSHNSHLSLYASTPSSSSRIGDLPTRLSGWFSHTFSSSSTDLSLPSLLASSTSSHHTTFSPGGASTSPKRSSGASALLAAAKHGKGHLDKAMRYLLDSDATPDRCVDPIWILGVRHPGYEPPPATATTPNLSASTASVRSLRSSVSSASDLTVQGKDAGKNLALNWPPVFYADFTSRVWLTYRSHFTPIRDGRLADLDPTDWGGYPAAGGVGNRGLGAESMDSPTVGRARQWVWGAGGGEKGWTSDSGWGCMLRTGQSLLANALVHLHLGRDWRRPPLTVHTADYATYVQILTWFFDTPAPEAPFSVHRMALAGKELGKDVGQWFGPSTAAGAIKTLVNGFPDAGLGVAVATDGVVFQSEVFTASHTGSASVRTTRRHTKGLAAKWGDRPVLVLIGVRLGLDGVNPIYYETIKLLYTFPQSVGIAGGRPSSSYYFVGSQADNLFYLDPHHARPAISLRPPPPPVHHERETTPDDSDTGSNYHSYHGHVKRANQRSPPPNRAATNSPSSVRTGSSTFSYHAPLSPSPLQKEFSTSGESASSDSSSRHHLSTHTKAHSTTTSGSASRSPSIKHHVHPSSSPSRFRSASVSHSPSPSPIASPNPSEVMHESELKMGTGLDPVQEHYITAYPAADLKTFHCERVRKMPLSGLDPSMLIGFLCKDEADWYDFRRRVGELPRTVFSVQEEPPTWPSDSDDNMGLESISEPDPDDLVMDMDMEDEGGEGDVDAQEAEVEEGEEGDQFYDTRSASASTSSASVSGSGSGSASGSRRYGSRAASEDTEEDPVDPITPLPNARFSIRPPSSNEGKAENDGELDDGVDVDHDGFEEGDIEDDWVDPSIPTPVPSDPPSILVSSASVPEVVHAKTPKKSRKGRKEVPIPVPLVRIPIPSSNRSQQEHFPFPVSQRSTEEASPTRAEHRVRHTSMKASGKRMHTARARDGGRTQSGGVKGILTDD